MKLLTVTLVMLIIMFYSTSYPCMAFISSRWSFSYLESNMKLKLTFLQEKKIPKETVLMERLDEAASLLHFEVRNTGWRGIFGRMSILPVKFRPKPLAKAGIRSFSVIVSDVDGDSDSLFAFIKENFPANNDYQEIQVAIFIYVWVKPSLRGQGIADILLDESFRVCRERGDQYMLLLHDDNGSGQLIEYYLRRGFIPCFGVVNKGMLIPVP